MEGNNRATKNKTSQIIRKTLQDIAEYRHPMLLLQSIVQHMDQWFGGLSDTNATRIVVQQQNRVVHYTVCSNSWLCAPFFPIIKAPPTPTHSRFIHVTLGSFWQRLNNNNFDDKSMMNAARYVTQKKLFQIVHHRPFKNGWQRNNLVVNTIDNSADLL